MTGHRNIDVVKLNIGGGHSGISEGRYAVIREEVFEEFVDHYNEIFSEREKALELGMKISEGTKHHDSLVKFVRWVFLQLKEIVRGEDHQVRMDLPAVSVFLEKLYDLKLADQTYCGPDEVDGEYEYTPVGSRWTIHLAEDMKEEHEHDDRAEESEEVGDGPGEDAP